MAAPRSIAVAMLAVVLVPTTASAAEARGIGLGSPNYVSDGHGWGKRKPARIYTGRGYGRTGLAVHIRWRHWGSKRTRGQGLGYALTAQNGYFRKRVRIKLLAKNVGRCPGEPALVYRTLLFRAPHWPGAPLGPWRKWGGSRSLCDLMKRDPRYWGYPYRPPGYCGYFHGNTSPGDMFDITAYRVACGRARRLARAARRRVRSRTRLTCSRHGCRRRVRGFRCRFERVHKRDKAPANGFEEPLQRVACRHGRRNVTWWYVLSAY